LSFSFSKTPKVLSGRLEFPFSSMAHQPEHDNDDFTREIPFFLADIGEGIAEVELLQWYVNVGDSVAQFDRICEVQSDKATVEITSRYDGVITSLNGAVGDMVAVGSPLLHLRVKGKATESATSSNDEAESVTLNNVDEKQDRLQIPSLESNYDIEGKSNDSTRALTAMKSSTKVLTTPAVRKLAMDYDLDLGNMVGTGPKGRILKADVKKLLRDKGLLEEETESTDAAARQPQPTLEEDTVVEIKGYNRLMVKSMTASLTIPHMCYADEVNMNAILKCRRELRPLAESHGIKLSLLPFAIKAASLSMKEYPVINSTLNKEQYKLTYRASHNIGVAMDTPRGLAVPVVKDCQNLSVMEIAFELERLKKLASEGSLSEGDITDATFTLSNIGAIGGTYMSPIVTSPQVAIGAMGRIQRLPRFGADNVIEEINIMQISWGGDHRVIDGATMARFSNQWKNYMESPMTMVFAMK
jgi:2-oxoisovalerate dehydrogenase E2 component (dihydrolipoyl transacylase)